MPGSFLGGPEVLQHAKDLVNIPKHCKVIQVVAIYIISHSLYSLFMCEPEMFNIETKWILIFKLQYKGQNIYTRY